MNRSPGQSIVPTFRLVQLPASYSPGLPAGHSVLLLCPHQSTAFHFVCQSCHFCLRPFSPAGSRIGKFFTPLTVQSFLLGFPLSGSVQGRDSPTSSTPTFLRSPSYSVLLPCYPGPSSPLPGYHSLVTRDSFTSFTFGVYPVCRYSRAPSALSASIFPPHLFFTPPFCIVSFQLHLDFVFSLS